MEIKSSPITISLKVTSLKTFRPSRQDILKAVAKFYKIRLDEIVRNPELMNKIPLRIHCRKIVIYLCRHYGYNWKSIHFLLNYSEGDTCNTTCRHLYRKIQNLKMDEKITFLATINSIIKEIQITSPSVQIARPDRDPARE